MRRRTLQIELQNPEPATLRAVVHNRLVPRASPLDYAVAVGSLFVCCALAFLAAGQESTFLLLWAGGLFSIVVGVPGAAIVRRIKQRFGRRLSLELALESGSLRDQPSLRVGGREISANEVEAVALLGWQEVAATDRLWDVMLILGDGGLDVVSGCDEEDPARELAKALAAGLHVELREASTTGGQVKPVKIGRRGPVG